MLEPVFSLSPLAPDSSATPRPAMKLRDLAKGGNVLVAEITSPDQAGREMYRSTLEFSTKAKGATVRVSLPCQRKESSA